MRVDTLPDDVLLTRISKDDNQAFRVIFERYKDRFYAAALKMTRSSNIAEDIVQEVFCTLWFHRSALSDIKHPESYLFTIVYNTISTHFKKMASEKSMKAKIKEKILRIENTTEQTVIEKEGRSILHHIIQQLPTQQQLIYNLQQDGFSRKEIAEKLGISPNTVKNHLLKATKFIRGHWGEVMMILTFILLQ